MSEAVKITDHVDQGLSRLISQYKGKPKLEGTLAAFLKPFQDLEDTFFDLRDMRSVEDAEGAQLEIMGFIVGEADRKGRDDDEYRLAIKAKIGQNTSRGLPEDVIFVLGLLTGATKVHRSRLHPATVVAMVDVDISGLDPQALLGFMQKVVAGGVRFGYIGQYDPVKPFAFAGHPFGGGFGSDGETDVGGKFASVVVVSP